MVTMADGFTKPTSTCCFATSTGACIPPMTSPLIPRVIGGNCSSFELGLMETVTTFPKENMCLLCSDLERHLAAHHSRIHSRHSIPLTNVSPLNNRRQDLLCQYGDRLSVIRPKLCEAYLIKAVVLRIQTHLFELFDAIAGSAGDETSIHHCIRDDWRNILDGTARRERCFDVLYGFRLNVERAKLGVRKTQRVENEKHVGDVALGKNSCSFVIVGN